MKIVIAHGGFAELYAAKYFDKALAPHDQRELQSVLAMAVARRARSSIVTTGLAYYVECIQQM